MTNVNCPKCGKTTVYEGNPFRPFCSEKCKLIDFGVWADGEYAVPAEPYSLNEEDHRAIEDAKRGEATYYDS